MSVADHGNDAAETDGRSPGGWSRRQVIGGAIAGLGAVAVGGRVAGTGLGPFGGDSTTSVGDRARRLTVPERRRWFVEQVGASVEGRPIHLISNVVENSRATVLAIAAVHGDERGAGAIGVDLPTVLVPPGVNAYVVPCANPDGWARGTRNNARDVDLNRNFPWWWMAIDGGPAAASEPETQTMMAVVRRLRPTLTVWIHQPYEYVSPIDPAALRYAEIWASAAGLPVRPFVSQHGGGESWTYHAERHASILVEGTSRDAGVDETAAHRRAFEAVLAAM
jgi:protein MpaA